MVESTLLRRPVTIISLPLPKFKSLVKTRVLFEGEVLSPPWSKLWFWACDVCCKVDLLTFCVIGTAASKLESMMKYWMLKVSTCCLLFSCHCVAMKSMTWMWVVILVAWVEWSIRTIVLILLSSLGIWKVSRGDSIAWRWQGNVFCLLLTWCLARLQRLQLMQLFL